MRILLINPVMREDSPPYVFPVGLGIIAAIMQSRGYDVKVFDHNATRCDAGAALREIASAGDVDVIGIGGLITTYKYVKRLIPALREKFPRAKIVLGGGITVEPETIFANIAVDVCVHGEGEHTFLELCNAYRDGAGELDHIDGISFLADGRLRINKPRALEGDLDQFPMPAYSLFPTEVYVANNALVKFFGYKLDARRCATVVTSRGCPNMCTFCWRMAGRTMRFRSRDLVMDELRYLKAHYDVDSYLFLDECINASVRKLVELCDGLVASGLDAPWYSHARVDNVTVQSLSKARASGCVGLNFGVESASPRILENMNKNATPEQAARAVQRARDVGIDPACTMMIGMVGETRKTIRQSVRWLRRNRVNASFFFTTPYPGCELHASYLVQQRIHERYGSHDAFFEALGDVTQFVVNMTAFSDKALIELQRRASTAGMLSQAPALARSWRLATSAARSRLRRVRLLREAVIAWRTWRSRDRTFALGKSVGAG